MPIFHCPVCNHKSFTEKEEKEHAKTHKNDGKQIKSEDKKPEEQKKEFKMPDFIKRFLHKTVIITFINGSTVSGELTGFNNYDLMLDDKILVMKHATIMIQEAKIE